MLSKRVIVLASDKPLQKRLAAGAMAAGGSVTAYATIDELAQKADAEVVLYATGWATGEAAIAPLRARLPETCRIVPVLPAPQLDSMVALLMDRRIAATLVAEDMTAQTVSSTVSKLLYGDLFGLEKVTPWGVRLYSMLVGDYQEKSHAIATIGDFASAMGVRRKYREQIDQCIDEMLMNALYDAPVDERGRPLFADVPVKDRVALRVEEKAMVQYACDGDRFAVSVRDTFGSLQKERILQVLDKCLHANGQDQIDRQGTTSRTGGAGLGLYLISNAATELYFHIFPGRATEVVVSFDLQSARSHLRSFGVFEESLMGSARAVPNASGIRTLPARRREDLNPEPELPAPAALPPPVAAPPSRALPVLMGASILLLFAAVGLAALPYLKKPPRAAMHVDSLPIGASIFIDGRARGNAPLDVSDLEAGRSYAVRATLKGHGDEDQLITAAPEGSTVKLQLHALAGQVALESDPPGAKIFVDGKDSGRLAPTLLELEPQKTVEITLRKQGFRDQKISVTGPGPGERAVYRHSLPLSPEVAGLTILSDPPTAAVYIDGMAQVPPGPQHDEFVKPGTLHHIKVSAPGYIDFREDVTLSGGEHKSVKVTLAQGGVLSLKTNVSARVFIDDKAVGSAPLAPLALAEGKHQLMLKSERPTLRWTTTVEVEKGKTVDAHFEFGIVEVKVPGVTARVEGLTEGVTLLQLPVGPQKLALVSASGEEKQHEVVIAPGARITIDTF